MERIMTHRSNLSLIACLKQATAGVHDELEKTPILEALVKGELSELAYIQLLKNLYFFHKPLEHLIEQHAFWSERTFNLQVRRKAQWLEQDLLFFKEKPNEILPEFEWPSLTELEQLIGCLYVLEGSSLGSLVISQLLAKKYGYGPDTGGRFYNAYGSRTQDYWRETRSLINEVTREPAFDWDFCILAAQQSFLTYQRAIVHDG